MRLLLAVDLHHDADRVVDAAAAWASRLGATLDLAYADTFRELSAWAPHPQTRALMVTEIQRLAAHAETELARLLARIPEACRGNAHLVDGRAVDMIPARAEEYDLVLVGTHGRQGLSHLLLGSVAERIARATPRPVLVIRDVPPEGAMSALCAVDVRDPQVTQALSVMVPWLEDLGAIADLAYASPLDVPPSPGELMFASTWMALNDAREAAEAARLDALSDALPEALRGKTLFSEGDVTACLAEAADGHALAVVVTHGRTGVERWWMGSVAERLVRLAPCSVLVLRRPQEAI
jgi:nucleotide-binding universal stress UspA family protein